MIVASGGVQSIDVASMDHGIVALPVVRAEDVDGRLDDGLDEGVGGRDLAPEEDVFGRVHEDRDHCGDV